MRRYSWFWLNYCAGLITLSPAWAERDDGPTPFEYDDWATWLRRSDAEHAVIVAEYLRPFRHAIAARK